MPSHPCPPVMVRISDKTRQLLNECRVLRRALEIHPTVDAVLNQGLRQQRLALARRLAKQNPPRSAKAILREWRTTPRRHCKLAPEPFTGPPPKVSPVVDYEP